MKKLLLTMLLITAMVMASAGMASAESILFPYVVYNTAAGLDTVVSIINTSALTQMHLRYYMKDPTAVNANMASCPEDNFFRPTTQNDIVTFAVGGTASLNGGNAMFGDATNYNAGAGAPSFRPAFVSPRIGYLVVTTAAAGADTVVGNTPFHRQLDGEASIYDITSGAMWGYRAIGSVNNSNADFIKTTRLNTTNANPGGVIDAPKLTFYPSTSFTSRLLVTPLTTDMIPSPTYAGSIDVGLYYNNNLLGIFDRNENTRSGGGLIRAVCVGRIDASTLIPNALDPTNGVLRTEGGWAYLGLSAGTANQTNVFDLKFGSLVGGSIVNDGKAIVPNELR